MPRVAFWSNVGQVAKGNFTLLKAFTRSSCCLADYENIWIVLWLISLLFNELMNKFYIFYSLLLFNVLFIFCIHRQIICKIGITDLQSNYFFSKELMASSYESINTRCSVRNSTISNKLLLTSGVPQGRVLGQFSLFYLSMNFLIFLPQLTLEALGCQNDVRSCFQIIAEIVKLLYTCACKRTGALV